MAVEQEEKESIIDQIKRAADVLGKQHGEKKVSPQLIRASGLVKADYPTIQRCFALWKEGKEPKAAPKASMTPEQIGAALERIAAGESPTTAAALAPQPQATTKAPKATKAPTAPPSPPAPPAKATPEAAPKPAARKAPARTAAEPPAPSLEATMDAALEAHDAASVPPSPETVTPAATPSPAPQPAPAPPSVDAVEVAVLKEKVAALAKENERLWNLVQTLAAGRSQ